MQIDLVSFVLGVLVTMLYTVVVTHKPKKKWLWRNEWPQRFPR
jgi:hypothetical protein